VGNELEKELRQPTCNVKAKNVDERLKRVKAKD